jgi:hypothetical protein
MTAVMQPAPERLWPRIDWPADPTDVDGCAVWTGASHPTGYGQIGVGGRTLYVHRIVWALTRGPIPPGLVVRHRCDRPACCNPRHLELGTQRDNMADMVARGRQPRGGRNGSAKLTATLVLTARRRVAAGELPAAVAADLGVSRSTVSRLANGRTWTCLRGTP